MYEAIDMAGGITEKGVSDALNLALVLEDGMRIMVPDEEQARQVDGNREDFRWDT